MRQNERKSSHPQNKKQTNRALYEKVKHQEKQAKEERLHFLEQLSEAMNLPADLVAGAPVVTMHGRNAVYIENHKKIAEYNEDNILVHAGLYDVLVEGKGLTVEYFSKEEMKISGIIRQVSYPGASERKK